MSDPYTATITYTTLAICAGLLLGGSIIDAARDCNWRDLARRWRESRR